MSHRAHGSGIAQSRPRGCAARTSIALSCIKLVSLGLGCIGFARATPLHHMPAQSSLQAPEAAPSSEWELWINLGTAIVLVLLGGALAGLTIALMGQDEIYLQVIATSGEGDERRNAAKVLWLLRKGKHWVLVTLLLGNVITNETLPIVLDRSIGGGWPAVAASTALVVIFGEIAPQSVCVRYGLPIGAAMAPFTLLLMWILFPISWPIAKLLDYLLGEDHGTTYKKAGLKQLVSLHKTLGTTPGERLNQDEVTIISAVLDLKDKSVGSIMTPMDDVFTLSADAILDEELMETIMREGYSRIPIHEPTRHGDFVGMLLVKMLITYDPEDCKRVSEFSLATLPETRPETSCLDIINFFQEGKSHMVLVSDYPGETYGAIGVVTLEDVIEELIGEEIIDESDVFIDVHKAIRRPALSSRLHGPKAESVTNSKTAQTENDESLLQLDEEAKANGWASVADTPRASYDSNLVRTRTSLSGGLGRSPTPTTTFYKRRRSASGGGAVEVVPVQMRGYTSEFKQQLKNLGPSNAANKPKSTRFNTVKIKPAAHAIVENTSDVLQSGIVATGNPAITTPLPTAAQEGVGRDLVSPGHSAKDGVQAVAASYGFPDLSSSTKRAVTADTQGGSPSSRQDTVRQRSSSLRRSGSHSTLGSLRGEDGADVSRSSSFKKGTVRTGSITEQFVDVGGVKKLVLEMTSSSEDGGAESKAHNLPNKYDQESDEEYHKDDGKRKKKKRNNHKKKGGSSAAGAAGGAGSGVAHQQDEKMPLLTPR